MSLLKVSGVKDIEDLALNPKVYTHATVKPSRETHKTKAHFKRNIPIHVRYAACPFDHVFTLLLFAAGIAIQE